MSQINVDAIRHTSASSDAITLASNGKCAVTGSTITSDIGNFTNLPNRNLIVNGSMKIAQRGTSSTSNGYKTVDRWYGSASGGTTTFSQGTETSGTVYEKGLSKYIRITNTANSTAAGSYRYLLQRLEGQDIVNSGWNFKSASSYITLSFWVRSSHAQNFYGYLRALDSPDSKYLFDTGSLTADTWTKVTKKIPGYTSMAIDNDNTGAFEVLLAPFWGTDFTASPSLNTWAAWNSGERAPDYATTWASANGATFDITGVQLEVGDYATDFEILPYGRDLERCKRYFQKLDFYKYSGTPSNYYYYNDTIILSPSMRATPTLDATTDWKLDTGEGQFQTSGGTIENGAHIDGGSEHSVTFREAAGAAWSFAWCRLWLNSEL